MDPRIIEMLQAQQAAQSMRFPGVEPPSIEVLDENESNEVEEVDKVEDQDDQEVKKNPYQPYLKLPPGNCNVYLYVAIDDKKLAKQTFLSDITPEVFKNIRMYLVFWKLIGQVYDKHNIFTTDDGIHKIWLPDVTYWYDAICKKQNTKFAEIESIVVDEKPARVVLKEIRIYCGDEPIEFMKFD